MGHNGGADARTQGERFEEIMEHVGKKLNTRTVYGEPVVVGERAVIPVAEVKYGGGGGWGSGHGPMEGAEQTAEENQGEGEGMGLGFGASAKPLGALEVTAEGVHWTPLFDWGKLVQIWSMVTGFVVVVAAVKWLFSRD